MDTEKKEIQEEDIEEEEDGEDGEDTPPPSSKTKFGFSDKTAESGISKLFVNALGKLSEKNPEEAYGVIEHLLSALGGSSPKMSPSPLPSSPPPGPMGAMMGPPPPPNMPPPPPPKM